MEQTNLKDNVSKANSINLNTNYIVMKDKLVPLFTVPLLKLDYDSGEFGTNCYKLDTVILPGMIIKILKYCGDLILQVEVYLGDKSQGKGYIHKEFIINSCQKTDFQNN